MNVVLPLPFGPRKPKISPRRTVQREVVDDVVLAEVLVHAAHVDGDVVRRAGVHLSFVHRQRHIDRLAGIEPPRRSGAGLASTRNTSLARFSLE